MTVMKIRTRETLQNKEGERWREGKYRGRETVQNLNFTNRQKEGTAAVLYHPSTLFPNCLLGHRDK